MAVPRVNKNVPQPPAPIASVDNLARVVGALKIGMDSLGGYTGDFTGRAVTFNDLITLGLVTPATVESQGGQTSFASRAALDEMVRRVETRVCTVAELPENPVFGRLMVVTDSTTNFWGASVTGGGTFKILAWFNGDAWTVLGI